MSSHDEHRDTPETEAVNFSRILRQLEALLQGEKHIIPNLANAAAFLWQAFDGINWAGFYLVSEGELLLGPFQGRPACVHIRIGRGVCGTAAAQNKTQVVENVHLFEGHIACDSGSNSELVVPLRQGGRVVGVLDIDSPLFARFGAAEARAMEEAARIIESACGWDACGMV